MDLVWIARPIFLLAQRPNLGYLFRRLLPRRSLQRIPALTAALVLSLLALSGPVDASTRSLARPTLAATLRDSATRLPGPYVASRPAWADNQRIVEEVIPPPPPPPEPPPVVVAAPVPFSERPVNTAVGVFIPYAKAGAYAPYPSIQAGHSDQLMLTFDDCGSPGQMEAIVNALAAVKRQGVFFITGQCRDRYPWLVDTLKAGGHLVCNHTYSHPDLRRLSDAAVRWEIGAGVFAGCGYFRPPYGSWDGPRGRIARIAAEFGLAPLLWDVDSRDWAGAAADRIATTALNRGGVVLMHLHGYNTAAAVRLMG